MLEVENISAGYGNKDVLRDLSFVVGKNEIYILLGVNGAGKTTTFRVISGILPPSKGKVLVDGINLWTEPEKAKRKIGYLPEGERIYPDLSVYKNMLFFAKVYKVDKKRINELLRDFGLEKYRSAKAGNLSRGLRKRLALARALLHDPEILVLDEPFSNLDVPGVLSLREKIWEMLRRGKVVLFSTHILTELQHFEGVKCKVGVINDGELVLEEKLDSLLSWISNIEVTIATSEPYLTIKLLKNLGYEVSTDGGSSVVVRVSNCSIEIPKIIKRLVAEDIKVYQVKPKDMPLEKIFMRVSRKNDGSVSTTAKNVWP
ncbi:ABC transporter ATP-binding protein [Candidatus Heimdallarchaeota archaeon]|nr:MAG: ABC transporter ATP-binding protein [Candidatus Heimdallarchaeota archaeon]